MAKIHSTAVVSSKAQINENVEIGPFCYVQDDTVIGSGTRLLNNVTVYSGTRLGEDNIIFPGAVLCAIPQDLKFTGEYSELIIGSRNQIRECVTLNRGTKASGRTLIGDDNLFMAYSHVAHDCEIGNHCILANSVALGGHVTLEDYAILGGLAGVHQFVKIGTHTMIGAKSMVVKDVIPFSLFSGDPLEYKGMNLVGLKRRGFSSESLEILKNAYHILFSSGMNTTQAVMKIKEQVTQNDQIRHLLNFIEGSSRGISK